MNRLSNLTPVLILVLLLSSLAGKAQTEKGDWLVGGLLDLNTAKNSTTFQFSPNAGYFLLDNLVFGGNLVFSYNKFGALKSTSFGIGPFVRYYFTENKIRPFFAGDMTFEKVKFTTTNGSSTEDAFNWFLGGGAAFFINENVALDGLIGYAHSKVTDEAGSGGLRLRLGFQVYINRHQAEQVRSTLSK
ncbi:MAG: porin family protein [Chitinophagaceae bacterium]|nr:porin family protein [Chitinophagaceae bacterium]